MKKYFFSIILAGLLLPSFVFAVSDGATAMKTLYHSSYFINISWSNPQVAVNSGIFSTSINLKSKTRKVQIFLDGVLQKTCLKKLSCAAAFKNFSEPGEHKYSYLLTDIKGKTETQTGNFEVSENAQVVPVTFTANGLNIPVGKSLSLLAQLKGMKNIYDMGLDLGGVDFAADENNYRITARQTNSNGRLDGLYTTEDVDGRVYTFRLIKDGVDYRTSGSIGVI